MWISQVWVPHHLHEPIDDAKGSACPDLSSDESRSECQLSLVELLVPVPHHKTRTIRESCEGLKPVGAGEIKDLVERVNQQGKPSE